MTLTAIDLFAGAGGSTAGLLLAGCDVRLAVESDKDAVATYKANFSQVTVLPDLVESYPPARILKAAGLSRGERPGILSACPPCQGFSTLGKSDPDDWRNDYVLMIAPLVESLRPRALILENVPGLARDPRLKSLAVRLRALGFGVGYWVLDANEFCVPQHRRRLVLIAVEGLSDAEVTSPSESYSCLDYPQHSHTVREVLRQLGPPSVDNALHSIRTLPQEVEERIAAIPADGGSREALPAHLQLECHKSLGKTGARSVYGRLAWGAPAPTMTTRCTTPACGRFTHPVENRPLTLREAAAFQSFWPTFHWRGGTMSIQRQIGNAVPVRMAWQVARHAGNLVQQQQAHF